MNYDWDLTSLYKSEEDYQKDLNAFKEMIPLFATFKGHLGEDEKLKEYFDLNIRLELLVNRLYAYAASKADLDRRVVESVSRENELRKTDFLSILKGNRGPRQKPAWGKRPHSMQCRADRVRMTTGLL